MTGTEKMERYRDGIIMVLQLNFHCFMGAPVLRYTYRKHGETRSPRETARR